MELTSGSMRTKFCTLVSPVSSSLISIFLQSKSPKALVIAKRPKTLSKTIYPPCFLILSYSSSRDYKNKTSFPYRFVIDWKINSLPIPAEKSSGIADISTNQFAADNQCNYRSSATGICLFRMRFFIPLVANFKSLRYAICDCFVQVLAFFEAFDFVQEFFF